MSDTFHDYSDNVGCPPRRAVAIVPSDDARLPELPRAIYVGIRGTLWMRGAGEMEPRAWHNVPSSSLIPFRAELIPATGTTAADMLALY